MRDDGLVPRSVLLAIALVALSFGAVSGAVLEVSPGGDGGAASIGIALSQLAAGDTLMLGPGEFYSTREATFPGASVECIIPIHQPDVVVLGSGTGVTYVGSAVGASEDDAAVAILDGASGVTIAGVTIRSMPTGVASVSGVGVRETHIQDCENGLRVFGEDEVVLDDVALFGCSNGVVSFGSDVAASGLDVQDCQNGIVQVGGTLRVRDSEFNACGVGVSSGGQADLSVVESCLFADATIVSMVVDGASQVLVSGSQFRDAPIHLTLSFAALVEVRECQFVAASRASVCVTNPGSQVQAAQNHFLGYGPYEVEIGFTFVSEPTELDFRGNHWRESDPEGVEALILDVLDDPLRGYLVAFLPLATGPVEAGVSSWGRIKSKYD